MKPIEIGKPLPVELAEALKEAVPDKERSLPAHDGGISPSTLRNVLNGDKVQPSHTKALESMIALARSKSQEMAKIGAKHLRLFNQYAA